MKKNILSFLLISLIVCIPALFSQQGKVTVIVKTASIYAEASENSYEIDRAKLGDVLTLFEPWQGEKEWLYVIFSSERWKGEVTGFIKSSLVTRGEIIPEELIAKTAAEAEVKEPESKEEEKTEKDELPSLRDILQPEEKKEEIREAEPEEKADVVEAPPVKPSKEEAEKEAAESKKAEIEMEDETSKPEPPQIEAKEEPIIEHKPEPVAVKVDTFLGETELAESRTIKPSDMKESESSIYDIKQVLPPAAETEVATVRIEAAEEFKTEETKPPPAQEEPEPGVEAEAESAPEQKVETEPETDRISRPETELETKLETLPESEEKPEQAPETEPELVAEPDEPEKPPVTTEIILTVSEMPAFRDIITPEIPAIEPKAYAVISITEDIPMLVPRHEVANAAAEAQLAQVDVEPYEIKPEEPERQEIPSPPQQKPPPELIKPKLPVAKRMGLLTIALGYGPSFGGLGASLQLNTKTGFSLHAGVGYYPANYYYSDFDWLENQILFSAGIKYYLPFKSHKVSPYLDLQYGGLSVEAVQLPIGYYEGVPILENLQKNLYGVSILGGLELRFGPLGASGALGASYNTTEWAYWDRDLFLNGEFAIIVNF